MRDWYLIRTKTGSEQIAQQQLQHLVDRTLLPLGKMQVCQRISHISSDRPDLSKLSICVLLFGRAIQYISDTPVVS